MAANTKIGQVWALLSIWYPDVIKMKRSCACVRAHARLQGHENMKQNHKLTSTVSVTSKATNKTMGMFKLMLFQPQHDPHIIYMFLPGQGDLNFLHRMMTNWYMHKKNTDAIPV